ncbi:hypothetical protein F4679DRAFT_595390 [Xylaria curta]|nr:hypothetical protein F4679DRAFT_595390 [Xylaria curta]
MKATVPHSKFCVPVLLRNSNVATRAAPNDPIKTPWETLSPHPSRLIEEHDRNNFYFHDDKDQRNHGHAAPAEVVGSSFLLASPLADYHPTPPCSLRPYCLHYIATTFEFRCETRETARGEVIGAIEHSLPVVLELNMPNVATPKIPGQCTTWPVAAKGDYNFRARHSKFVLQSFAPRGGCKKPQGIAVKALIFYGRKRTVDFLDRRTSL